MNKFFTTTFFKFLFGFVALITVAFGVLLVTSHLDQPSTDNLAHPSDY